MRVNRDAKENKSRHRVSKAAGARRPRGSDWTVAMGTPSIAKRHQAREQQRAPECTFVFVLRQSVQVIPDL